MSTDAHDNNTVMIVEDDRDVLDAMAEALEDFDYRVVRAAHGQEALERLRDQTEKPRVILLDIQMPVMDGWRFRAEQQVDPNICEVPVVIVSAHVRVREAAQQMQATAALEKPVKLETLLSTVARFCGKSAGLKPV